MTQVECEYTPAKHPAINSKSYEMGNDEKNNMQENISSKLTINQL